MYRQTGVFIGTVILLVIILGILGIKFNSDKILNIGDGKDENNTSDDNKKTIFEEILESFNEIFSSNSSGGSSGSSGGGGSSSSSSGGSFSTPSTITRSFSSNSIGIGENLTVTIEVLLNNNERYYLFEESIPQGFVLIDSGSGNSSEEGYIRWIEYEEVISQSYNYIMRATEEGEKNFLGRAYIEGFSEIANISGEDSVLIY